MRPYQQERRQEPRQPPRYKNTGIGAVENMEDEAIILADQDETGLTDLTAAADEAMENSDTLLTLEPPEFTRGEVDVKEQMDRTTRNMEDTVNHTHMTDKSETD